MALKSLHGHDVPTFLGIGPPKCGTTWLDAVLRKHPDVLLPKSQKEVFFFSRYFDRGRNWYLDLFSNASSYCAVGEISTNYILERSVLERIAQFNPKTKLIVILRDPADRIVSHYRMYRENSGDQSDIDEVLQRYKFIERYSNYGERLGDLYDLFPREQIFIGICEEIFKSKEAEVQFLEALAEFLNVDPLPMRDILPDGKIRETRGAPRNRFATRLAKRGRRILRDHDLEWLVALLAKAGVDRELFMSAKTVRDTTSIDVLRRLDEQFAGDRERVAERLGRPIHAWSARVSKRAVQERFDA